MIETAMLLAAGMGQRMGCLTDTTPKPLLRVGNTTLLAWHLQQLERAGVRRVVINIAHHAEQMLEAIAQYDGQQLSISCSQETVGTWKTGGGIIHALPLLGDQPFFVISADTVHQFPLHKLSLASDALGHIVLKPNANTHSQGDFHMARGQLIAPSSKHPSHTYASIGVFRPAFFNTQAPHSIGLGTLLQRAIDAGHTIQAQLYRGWHININTPKDLTRLREQVTDLKILHAIIPSA